MKTRPPAARAFTTIELMVSMAIIVVLLGIVIFGYRRVATGGQANQTKTQLERLRSMTATLTGNKQASQKFFQQQIPYVYATPVGSADEGDWWQATRASADESLYRTALVLKAILQSPEARAIFDELPADRKRTFYFVPLTGKQQETSTGALTFVLPVDAWGSPILFVFDNWQRSTGGVNSTLRTVAVPGTPPTYLSTGGLTDLYSESAKGYWELPSISGQPPVASLPYLYDRNTKFPTYTALGDAIRAPDRQPFWASAGPDGLMQTQDDNVYSFEN